MRTNIERIFAAGDCVQTYHRLLETDTYLPLETTAHKQGRVAGENAVGGDRKVRRVVGCRGEQAVSGDAEVLMLSVFGRRALAGPLSSTLGQAADEPVVEAVPQLLDDPAVVAVELIEYAHECRQGADRGPASVGQRLQPDLNTAFGRRIGDHGQRVDHGNQRAGGMVRITGGTRSDHDRDGIEPGQPPDAGADQLDPSAHVRRCVGLVDLGRQQAVDRGHALRRGQAGGVHPCGDRVVAAGGQFPFPQTKALSAGAGDEAGTPSRA
jgi:hypothetical protein